MAILAAKASDWSKARQFGEVALNYRKPPVNLRKLQIDLKKWAIIRGNGHFRKNRTLSVDGLMAKDDITFWLAPLFRTPFLLANFLFSK